MSLRAMRLWPAHEPGVLLLPTSFNLIGRTPPTASGFIVFPLIHFCCLLSDLISSMTLVRLN